MNRSKEVKMTYSDLPRILTPEEVADYLKIDRNSVVKELEEGRLHGFQVGLDWRCTDTSLLDYINRSQTISLATQSDISKLKNEAGNFVEIEPFDYKWPQSEEHFENGHETTININGRAHVFKFGFTDREVAGRMRRKAVVWIDNWPLVEFASGNDYESDGLLASVIKTQGGRQLRPSAKLPEEYKGFKIDRYDSIVQGPYASRNMAVIVHKDDLKSMLEHAVIRAQSKGII
jgi:excisionase family DNA binding protein